MHTLIILAKIIRNRGWISAVHPFKGLGSVRSGGSYLFAARLRRSGLPPRPTAPWHSSSALFCSRSSGNWTKPHPLETPSRTETSQPLTFKHQHNNRRGLFRDGPKWPHNATPNHGKRDTQNVRLRVVFSSVAALAGAIAPAEITIAAPQHHQEINWNLTYKSSHFSV